MTIHLGKTTVLRPSESSLLLQRVDEASGDDESDDLDGNILLTFDQVGLDRPAVFINIWCDEDGDNGQGEYIPRESAVEIAKFLVSKFGIAAHEIGIPSLGELLSTDEDPRRHDPNITAVRSVPDPLLYPDKKGKGRSP